MAVLRGIQEKVQFPLYDAVFVRPRQQLREVESSSVLKFFVNVQRKSKLETNMQTASLLPHWNVFEARSLRVIISDLPAVFPDAVQQCLSQSSESSGDCRRAFEGLLDDERRLSAEDLLNKALAAARAFEAITQAAATIQDDIQSCLDPSQTLPNEETTREILGLAEEVRALRSDLADILSRTGIQTPQRDRVRELAARLEALSDTEHERLVLASLERLRECFPVFQQLGALSRQVKSLSPEVARSYVSGVDELVQAGRNRLPRIEDLLRRCGSPTPRPGAERPCKCRCGVPAVILRCLADRIPDKRLIPIAEQLIADNVAIFAKLIYNSVTTLTVGEKTMIQMPTWFFPSGAGPFSEDGRVVTHGFPTPEATFRFAEPVFIDTKQNFRVEIEIPEAGALGELQRLFGPLFIWVLLDGYRTREVQ